jgi:fucose 4-O-acetylase-like acetyltransferase
MNGLNNLKRSKMNKKIVKTLIVFLGMLISSLLTPIIGQLYQQQTGIEPIAFYGIVVFGGLGIAAVTLFNVWEN